MIVATAQDWITAVATGATAVIALAAAGVTGLITYRHREAAALEAYLKLEELAERPSSIQARAAVARGYLEKAPTDVPALIVALGGFERIAFAAKNNVISKELVWSYAGDRILAYWYAFEQQILARNTQEQSYWEDLKWLRPRLEDINRQKGVRIWDGDKHDETIRTVMRSESVLDGGPRRPSVLARLGSRRRAGPREVR
jgi:hypothetical protein